MKNCFAKNDLNTRFIVKTKIFFALLFSLGYYKTRKLLLKNVAAYWMIIFITKRVKIYYKTGQPFYCKTRHGLLQNSAGITKRDKGYDKKRHVIQFASIITKRSSTHTSSVLRRVLHTRLLRSSFLNGMLDEDQYSSLS